MLSKAFSEFGRNIVDNINDSIHSRDDVGKCNGLKILIQECWANSYDFFFGNPELFLSFKYQEKNLNYIQRYRDR